MTVSPADSADLPIGIDRRNRSGQSGWVDAAQRARARRVALSRVVLILAALAAAALLILIVVGTLTSDTTEEVGQPKFGHIGQTIR